MTDLDTGLNLQYAYQPLADAGLLNIPEPDEDSYPYVEHFLLFNIHVQTKGISNVCLF